MAKRRDTTRYGAEAAEAVGTFSLVLAGCGAIMVDSLTGALGNLGIAATFGLVVAAMVYAAGHVSGAHFNPAVTIAFAATQHFPWRRVPGYLFAQVGGALAAAFLLRSVLGNAADVGAAQPAAFIDTAGLVTVELLITAMLMFVISSVATDGRAVGTMAGVAIGAAVAVGAAWAGPLTGASMNPARSIGPAFASGVATDLWIYMLVPTVGALLGALAYEGMRRASTPVKHRT